MKAVNRVRIAVVVALCLFFSVGWSVEQLPDSLTDDAFWTLITDSSEPGGSFVSDNFVSNELALQEVLDPLTNGRRPGGVYLGVGPEQNFTYIAALKPKIAFVFDIRKQNMLEHLMYKALFELSTDRANFLSRLFSRSRPADIEKDSSVVVLFNAFQSAASEEDLFQSNLQQIKRQLIEMHRFELSSDDEAAIAYILRSFFFGRAQFDLFGSETSDQDDSSDLRRADDRQRQRR